MSETATFNPNKTVGDESAFKNRSRAGGSFSDPNALDYKSLSPGESVDIRFLDMSKEAFLEIPCRRVGKRNPKNNQQMTIVVRDFGVEAMNGMVDNYGQPINDCKQTFLYRLPVWVEGYRTVDKKGETEYHEVQEVKYIEFGPGLSRSLDDLEKLQDGACSFDKATGLPHYDVRLSIIDGPSKEIPKNYEFEPIMFDAKNKRVVGSFGQSLVERFSEEQIAQIQEQWPKVIEAMNKLDTLEDVKRNLEGYKKGEGGKSLSVRGDDQPADYSVD